MANDNKVPVTLNVSMETYEEIFNALEANGIKNSRDASITISKDVSIKSPINYRQVTVRRDVLEQVVKVYEPRMNNDGSACLTDSVHFINFFNDVYNYVLKGEIPTPPENKNPSATITPIKKSTW